MILVEERLRALFETLPVQTIDGSQYKPAFDFGSHEDLLRYLKQKQKEGGKVYPLIWLETPLKRTGNENRVKIDLKLVLATLTNSNMSNTERLEVTIKPTLIPLEKNIRKGLSHSGFTRILKSKEAEWTVFFNYGLREVQEKEEKHASTEIWDAVKFECELEITNCKQKNINY